MQHMVLGVKKQLLVVPVQELIMVWRRDHLLQRPVDKKQGI